MRPYPRIFASAVLIAFGLITIQALPKRAQVRAVQDARTPSSIAGSLLSTVTPQPLESTPTEVMKPTRLPRPTPTPIPTPPPTNPKTIQMMAAFGILVVVVILFGIFINRRQVF